MEIERERERVKNLERERVREGSAGLRRTLLYQKLIK